jgi:hypothetical protein
MAYGPNPVKGSRDFRGSADSQITAESSIHDELTSRSD